MTKPKPTAQGDHRQVGTEAWHDPLCPAADLTATPPRFCHCALIARVRAEYPTWPELVVQTRAAVADEIAQAITKAMHSDECECNYCDGMAHCQAIARRIGGVAP